MTFEEELDPSDCTTCSILVSTNWWLAIRGRTRCPSNTAELYDPSGTFTQTNGKLSTARYFHTAILLNNRMVLFAGGQVDPNGAPTGAAELYDYTTGFFTPTGVLNTPRDEHAAILLSNGGVLIVGGVVSSVIPAPSTYTLSPTANAEFYPPVP